MPQTTFGSETKPLTVFIDKAHIPGEEIDAWELTRAKAVLRLLEKRFKVRIRCDVHSADLVTLREECVRAKSEIGRTQLRAGLANLTSLSAMSTKLVSWLSFGRRKQCVTEIIVAGLDARTVAERIDELMCIDTPENDRANLGACPDHYVLEARNNQLEVIETTGGSPMPIQIFIRFNDAAGLKTEPTAGCAHESVGTARLKDGTIAGGVRHQFRDTEGGLHARLMVEFPTATPRKMIREHQFHLACEWSRWLLHVRGA